MELIRPLYCVHEDDIIAWRATTSWNLSNAPAASPRSARSATTAAAFQAAGDQGSLGRLQRDNPDIEKSIFNSIHAVALDTMPGFKTGGVEHSFLERFNAMESTEDE